MPMKPIALGLAAAVLALYFVVHRYDEADSKLKSFYVQIASANFQGAREDIDNAIQLWPGNARYYAWRAYATSQKLPSQCPRCAQQTMTMADQAVAGEAIADYRRALDRNSRDAVAHHNLAWLEHLSGDDTAAGKNFQQATALDPGNAAFYLSYGMFLEETGDLQAGRERYEAAIEMSPAILDSPFFTRYRASFQEAAESIVAHCISRIEEKLQHGADPILEARLGKLYEFSGNMTRAAELLQGAAEKLPNLPLVWLNLGDIRDRQGNTAEAMNCYKKANVIDGTLASPYLRMGQIYLQRGQKTLAVENLQMAAQRWERVKPITAAHNNRLYVGPSQPIDDLLPTTLVWFTTPCEASAAYRDLAVLVPPKQRSFYLQRTNTCEEIPSPHLCLRGN